MITLSLDPSLRAYGWAVFDNQVLKACGCQAHKIRAKLKSDQDTQMIDALSKDLILLIDTYHPDQIIFENPVGAKSALANKALSLVKGMTIALAISKGIPYQTIKAKAAKKALTKQSNATKEEILKIVTNELSNFTTLTKSMPKYKVFAASDAAAVFLGS